MRLDPSFELRSGYIGSLANLMYKGVNVPAFDEIRDSGDVSKNYIIISGQTFTEDSLKCGFATDNAISLNIITTFAKGTGTKKTSEEIANMILDRVYPENGETGITINNFHIWKTRLLMNKTLIDETADQRIITKILTFQHNINSIV